jgi:ATP-dependent Clp protease ATP-binding subunit ClpB
LAERHITLELTDEAATHLAREGYDPVYGARPLKRAIQRELETPIGRLLIKGEVRDGQTVVVDWKDGRFTFTAKETEPAAQQVAG